MRSSILLVLAAVTLASTASSQQWEAWWRNQAESVLERAAAERRVELPSGRRDEIVAALTTALDDPHHRTRQGAVRALARLDAPADVLTPVLADEKIDVRRSACLALGLSSDVAGVPVLIDVMADTPSGRELTGRTRGIETTTRSMAALCLGLRGNTGAIPVRLDIARGLLERARQDTEASVRIDAALALGAMRANHAAEFLTLGARSNENDATFRAACAWSLGRLRAARHTPVLVELLRSAPPAVARSATLALRGRKDATALKALLDVAAERRDEGTANLALLALGEADSARARTALLESWKKGAPDASAFAATALSIRYERRGETANGFRRELLECIAEEKNPTRLAAAMIAVSRSGHAEADQQIRHRFASHWNPAVRADAALALAFLGDVHARPALREIVFDRGDPALRSLCARAIGLVGGAEERQFLLEELTMKHHPWQVRVGIAHGLFLDGNPDMVDRLLEVVTDRAGSHAHARALSAWLLGRLQDDPEDLELDRTYHGCDPQLESPTLRILLSLLP